MSAEIRKVEGEEAYTDGERVVRVRQRWAFQDGERRFVFEITSIKVKWAKICVFGKYINTSRFIGGHWTVPKLLSGYRGAVLVENVEPSVAFVLPKEERVEKEKPRKVRLRLPKGLTQGEARRSVLLMKRRFGEDVMAISDELAFAPDVVRALLEGA